MKIAYLLGSLNRGGMETLLLDVFKNASKADFDFIGIYRKDGNLKSDFYETGQIFLKLSPKFPIDFVYLYKLRKLLKKERINIVHAQQPIDAVYARIACLGTKIKIVQTLHGYDNLTDKKNKLMSLAFKLLDKNIFVSNFQREYYAKKYALKSEKQATVYNGISFEKFDEKYEIPDFLCHCGLDPQSPNNLGDSDFRQNDGEKLKMAMVGNFVRGREQKSVCKFLKLLREKGIAFDFYFVGKKNEAELWRYDDCVQYCMENELNDCVHFLGSRNDIPAILQNIDVFIYSTDHDTFGLAVVEAIAIGLPVFVNDWEVMTEITDNGKLAILSKTKNEQDLLEKFMLFLQDRSEYAEKAKVNSLIVRDKFSIEKHLQNLKKEYDSIC